MKRLAFTTICALALTEVAFAQGTLSWTGFIPAAITAETNTSFSPLFGSGGSGVHGPIASGVSGPTFYFELLYYNVHSWDGSMVSQPATLSALESQWTDTGLKATNTAVAGRILPVTNTTAASVSGWAGGIGTLGGTTNYIMLVGWSANLGTSWSEALTALQNWVLFIGSPTTPFFGMSTIGWIVPNTGNPGAPVFSTSASINGLPINSPNMQLYTLAPEPGTFVLAGLGGLTLLCFRRRKSS